MDLYSLASNQRALGRLGVVFCALVLGVAGLVVAQFNGLFSGDPTLRVQLPAQSSVVAVGSPVTYRDVRIGKVLDTAGPGADTVPEVQVEIERRWLDRLPRDVVATVGPVSIFGNQYVQLLSPSDDGPAGLADDATIPAYDARDTPSLQGTFVSLNDLLKEVSPAKLNAGLSGLATALQGQGEELGKTLVSTNDWLGLMLPLWPTLVTDLDQLAQVAGGLEQVTPELLSLVENATVSARTVNENAAAFRALVSDGGKLVSTTSGLLRDTIGSYADTVEGAVALLAALSQGPDVITQLLRGIDTWAASWAPALADGMPDVRLASLSVRNPADLTLVMAAGGNPADVVRLLNQAVRPGFANPPTYQGCPAQLCAFSKRPTEGSTP